MLDGTGRRSVNHLSHLLRGFDLVLLMLLFFVCFFTGHALLARTVARLRLDLLLREALA